MQMTIEPRKVIPEEDFEYMQLLEKKTEDGLSIKQVGIVFSYWYFYVCYSVRISCQFHNDFNVVFQNSEKGIPKKKDGEEKSCKVAPII